MTEVVDRPTASFSPRDNGAAALKWNLCFWASIQTSIRAQQLAICAEWRKTRTHRRAAQQVFYYSNDRQQTARKQTQASGYSLNTIERTHACRLRHQMTTYAYPVTSLPLLFMNAACKWRRESPSSVLEVRASAQCNRESEWQWRSEATLQARHAWERDRRNLDRGDKMGRQEGWSKTGQETLIDKWRGKARRRAHKHTTLTAIITGEENES